MKQQKTSIGVFIAIALSLTFAAQVGRHDGRIAGRIDLSSAMTSLVLHYDSQFPPYAQRQLLHWLSIQRKQLQRDRKWRIGSGRKSIDDAIARLDECTRKLTENDKVEQAESTVPVKAAPSAPSTVR